LVQEYLKFQKSVNLSQTHDHSQIARRKTWTPHLDCLVFLFGGCHAARPVRAPQSGHRVPGQPPPPPARSSGLGRIGGGALGSSAINLSRPCGPSGWGGGGWAVGYCLLYFWAEREIRNRKVFMSCYLQFF